jgi:hypothetical protein
METFQKIVLYTAAIVLLVALVFVGISLTYSKSNMPWPPITPECPDYWTIDGSGNNAVCINMKNLGTCRAQAGQRYLKMNFNKAPFVGTNSNCAKYQWANRCKVSWDGITYGVNNPCSK